RLANYLINHCKGKWILIIKNTKLIRDLYIDKGLNIKEFDKTYLVSFMNRNDKKTKHLIIANYC
ncbi:MAG: DNA adenine methylase, partial [Candidatus Zixiibacteriota bacterium]